MLVSDQNRYFDFRPKSNIVQPKNHRILFAPSESTKFEDLDSKVCRAGTQISNEKKKIWLYFLKEKSRKNGQKNAVFTFGFGGLCQIFGFGRIFGRIYGRNFRPKPLLVGHYLMLLLPMAYEDSWAKKGLPYFLSPFTLSPVTLSRSLCPLGSLCPRSLCPLVTLSPGHFVPRSLCPRSLCSLVIFSPGHFVPSHFVPSHFVPYI
jgi:hypothetical protein